MIVALPPITRVLFRDDDSAEKTAADPLSGQEQNERDREPRADE